MFSQSSFPLNVLHLPPSETQASSGGKTDKQSKSQQSVTVWLWESTQGCFSHLQTVGMSMVIPLGPDTMRFALPGTQHYLTQYGYQKLYLHHCTAFLWSPRHITQQFAGIPFDPFWSPFHYLCTAALSSPSTAEELLIIDGITQQIPQPGNLRKASPLPEALKVSAFATHLMPYSIRPQAVSFLSPGTDSHHHKAHSQKVCCDLTKACCSIDGDFRQLAEFCWIADRVAECCQSPWVPKKWQPEAPSTTAATPPSPKVNLQQTSHRGVNL